MWLSYFKINSLLRQSINVMRYKQVDEARASFELLYTKTIIEFAVHDPWYFG
jgi:hypothetical protein